MPTLAPKLVAEFIGAWALVFIGSGAVAMFAPAGHIGLLGIAMAHGLVIMTMVLAVGHISGGHFNPAVTFGFVVTRRMVWKTGLFYWIAQLLGAIIGVVGLKHLVPEEYYAGDVANVSVPALGEGVSAMQGMGIEAVLTFLLVWVIFGAAADSRNASGIVAGIAIGFTITLDILMGGPLTGAAMNPARAFGPMLATGEFGDAWLYWVGPLLGGGLAALLYTWVNKLPAEEKVAA
uniref:MIP family channel protein n=1 Tax=uncultured bacterium W5-102b TaxID=1130996 RepID=H9BWJ6_9BACT|nr:MIP family channel protein [uncultured bacterium W5-102b]